MLPNGLYAAFFSAHALITSRFEVFKPLSNMEMIKIELEVDQPVVVRAGRKPNSVP